MSAKTIAVTAEDEPCIGYCDPPGVGKHPHPDWPADEEVEWKICDECLYDHIEGCVQDWVRALGAEKAREIIEGIL
jgi:hypothetical protein